MTINSIAKTNTDTQAKIVRDLEKLTTWTIIETNKYLETFEIYGKTLQDYKDTMNTADFTKFFQYIVNDVIEAGIEKLGLNGVREEVSGYDYKFHDTPVEFKLMGGESKSSFATGNKTSHFGGAKTNLVWAIK